MNRQERTSISGKHHPENHKGEGSTPVRGATVLIQRNGIALATDVINITRTIGTRAMTDSVSPQHFVSSMEALERLYGEPFGPSLVKESDRITHRPYRALHRGGAVLRAGLGRSRRARLLAARRRARASSRSQDEKTLLIPDRRGNNRIDTLRNIIHDPRVALLFLIPGCGRDASA